MEGLLFLRGGWEKKRGWGDTCIKTNDKWRCRRQRGWAWGISNGICLFCICVVGWNPVELLSTWMVSLSQWQCYALRSMSLVRSATELGLLRGVAGLTLASELHLRPRTDVGAAWVKGVWPVLPTVALKTDSSSLYALLVNPARTCWQIWGGFQVSEVTTPTATDDNNALFSSRYPSDMLKNFFIRPKDISED